MREADATVLIAAPKWSDPRVHLLNDTWLLTIFAILVATALPWAVSSLRVSIAGAAVGLSGLALIHVGFAALVNPARAASPRRALALVALHVAGIVVVGFIWHCVGGLQNPAFLLVFALPVVGAIFLSRRQPYLIAVSVVLTVCVVAMVEAPELRWYASGLSGPGSWIAAIFGDGSASSIPAFPGLYAPSDYYLVMLEVFAVLLFGCAVAADYLGSVFARLHSQLIAAQLDGERAQELWTALIEHLPIPVLLIDTETLQITSASSALADRYCEKDTRPAGRKLFDALKFSYPEAIEELVAGVGGTARLSVIHSGSELRITDVHVQHLARRGRRFAVAVIEDKTEAFYVKAALDVANHAAMVLDTEGRILAHNKLVHTLFANAEVGDDASDLLAHPGTPARWWEPSLSVKLKLRVEIRRRLYQVTSTALSLPGEEQRIYVVAFRPAQREALGDRSSITATMVQLS